MYIIRPWVEQDRLILVVLDIFSSFILGKASKMGEGRIGERSNR